MADEGGAHAARESQFLLAGFERRVLPWLACRLPRWVLPDHLTLLGVLAAAGIAAAYVLSNLDPVWLWAASTLLVVHWLGDSLDGTLARVRRIERPRYGYYLDHLTDALATILVGVGLGLSPYLLLFSGLVLVVVYLALSINVYLEAQALRVFRMGYSHLGPTEARVALIALNTLLALGIGADIRVAGLGLTALDVVVLAVAAMMAVTLVLRAARNLTTLAREEPSARRRARMA